MNNDDVWDRRMNTYMEEAEGQIAALRAALDQEREKVERLAAMLARVADALDRADCSEGWCMCGDGMSTHTGIPDHSPADAGEYFKRKLLDEAAALLSGRGEVGDG